IDVPDALKIVSQLNKERWGDKGDTFKSEEFNRFHHSLADSFSAKGWLYLRLLKVDGQFAAARYDFLYDNKLWNYQNGWLPELSHLSLGKMMIGDCVKWCIEQGIREYDFLAGDTDYKKSWATASRQLMTIEVTNPSSRKALAYQQLRRIKNYMERKAAS
ncbi:MAG: GNAT family N-acetyltransferase, partial [Verrucomicrobiota bacterium]